MDHSILCKCAECTFSYCRKTTPYDEEREKEILAVMVEQGYQPVLQVAYPYPKCVYFVTFTVVDGCQPDCLLKAVQRVMKCKYIKAYRFVFELTEKGLPHVHALMFCNETVSKTRVGNCYRGGWKSKQQGLGFIDMKTVKTRDDEDRITTYMDKDAENNQLKEWLHKYSLERVYASQKT